MDLRLLQHRPPLPESSADFREADLPDGLRRVQADRHRRLLCAGELFGGDGPRVPHRQRSLARDRAAATQALCSKARRGQGPLQRGS